MRTIIRISVLLAALSGAAAWAQTSLGRILGTVRDPSQSAVPGVLVVVTNDGTGWRRDFLSQEDGGYEVTNLVPGTYTISAELAGFKRFVRPSVVLESGRTVRIDVALEVGELRDEMRVEAHSPVVESETPSIANVIDWEVQMKSAHSPQNRPWEALITVPTFASGASAFVYTIAGSRGAQNEFHIDGIASSGGGTPLGSTSMTTGASRELKVLAVNNSAEYSQSGIYQQISHGGANEFHGTIQYSHENSVLNARPYFSPTRPKGRNHRYGFSAGGPLVLPHLYDGRNRTFFLVSYEAGRTPATREAQANVPTAAMRAGDFSGLGAIRDPLTGSPFDGNRIPASRISPESQRIQDRFYPMPNFGNTAVFTALNHRILFDATGQYEHYDARIDQKIGARNTLYARLGWQQFPVIQMESNLPTIGFLSRLRTFWNPVLSDTHTFTPRLVNEFRVGFVRSQDPFIGPQKGLEVLAYAGIQGIGNVPDAFGMPVFDFGSGGVQRLAQSRQAVLIDQQGQLTDSLTWVRGRHTWKMGLDVRRALPYDTDIPVGTYGEFAFTGAFSGNTYSDFLLGLPQESRRAYPPPNDFRRQTQWGFFVQDDFKLNQRLTLQLGLRYEYQTPTTHGRNTLYNFDPASGRVILASEDALSQVSPLFNPTIPIVVADGETFPLDGLWHSDQNNWAPRVGFAFRPSASNDFVIRGGYGTFYDLIGYGVASSFTGGPFTRGLDRFVNQITGGQPLFQFPTPFTSTAAGPSTTPPALNAIIPGLVNPYVSQWNLSVEKEYFETGFRASYIGTKGTRLLFRRNINVPLPSATPASQGRRPYPLYGDITLFDQGGNSTYHGFQVEARRRLQAFSFDVGYTWSNTISDAPDLGDEVAPSLENPFDRRAWRGREEYALQHRFTGTAFWPIPVGKGRRFLGDASGLVNGVLGGWETTWTLFLQSGSWFHPTFTGRDISNTGVLTGRPDRLSDGSLSDPSPDRWFDAAAFAVPPVNAGRYGSTGRNILEGPGLSALHLGLFKVFRLYEDFEFTLGFAGRNLFNRPNFRNPNANITAPNTVGTITAVKGDLERAATREIEVRLLLSW